MNLQALMKQAQSMQKNMLNAKNKIDSTEFVGKSELVEVKMNGKREVLAVNILSKELDKDDVEILEDMIMIAVNDAIKKIDKEISDKMETQAGAFEGLL